LDGPFPKLCPAVTLSHQDGRHSAVALLLKAALIQPVVFVGRNFKILFLWNYKFN
jgi:hypothetical protein